MRAGRSELTPSLESCEPTSGGVGTLLRITGSGFGGIDATVSIGGAACAVTERGEAHVVCAVSERTSAGTHPIKLNFDPFGSTAQNEGVTRVPRQNYIIFPRVQSACSHRVVTPGTPGG